MLCNHKILKFTHKKTKTFVISFNFHWCLRRFPVRQVSIALRSTLVSEACSLFDKCLLPFALHWCLRHVPCSTSVYCPSLYIGV